MVPLYLLIHNQSGSLHIWCLWRLCLLLCVTFLTSELFFSTTLFYISTKSKSKLDYWCWVTPRSVFNVASKIYPLLSKSRFISWDSYMVSCQEINQEQCLMFNWAFRLEKQSSPRLYHKTAKATRYQWQYKKTLRTPPFCFLRRSRMWHIKY